MAVLLPTLALSSREQNDNKALLLADITTDYGVYGDHLVEGDFIEQPTNGYQAAQIAPFYEVVTWGGVSNWGISTGYIYWNGDTVAGNDPGSRGSFQYGDAAAHAIALGVGDELIKVTPKFTEVIRANLIDITYTAPSGNVTAIDDIVLFDGSLGDITDQSQLSWVVTNEMFGFDADAELPDGLYQFNYQVYAVGWDNASVYSTRPVSEPITILVYGQTKVKVYEQFRALSTEYMCKGGAAAQEVLEAVVCGAYMTGMENSAYIAKTEELLNMIATLNDMVDNGTKITY